MADVTKITLPNGTTKDIKDATARSNVVLLETMNGAKNITPYSSGEHTGNASYWFLHSNCIDIAAGTSVYLVFDYTITAGQYSLQLTDENGQIISGTAAYTTEGTTSGHKTAKVTVPTGKTAKGYNAYHNSNATVTISNFMIVPAEIYEAGFTDYQPYSLPNTKITPELIELVDSGAKNELNVTATSSGNFTINSDKSITVNGSFSQAAEYTLASPTGTVKGVLSGCTNGSNSTYRMWIQYKINNGSVQRIDLLDGSVELDLSNVTWSAVQIRVESGQTLNNVKFYPMLCSKAAWDVSQKFVPYRPTYEETVEQVAENENNISYYQENGSKNALDCTLKTLKTLNATGWTDNVCNQNGVNYTVNNDGSITVSGTSAAGDSYFKLSNGVNIGDCKLTGCPSGGGAKRYMIYANTPDKADTGRGNTYTGNSGTVYIIVRTAMGTVTDLEFKPMISPASMDSTYTNPHKSIFKQGGIYMAIIDSVRKLAEKVGADTNGRTIADQLNIINEKLDNTQPGSRDIAEAVSKFADKEDGTAILITKTITENKTYKASDDGASGYSSVTVNVPAPTPETFEVNISATETPTVDKTYAEIKAAIEGNKKISGVIDVRGAQTMNILNGCVHDIVRSGQTQVANAIIIISEVFVPSWQSGTSSSVIYLIITPENTYSLDITNINIP